ncbi:DUF983 domain-containing protein [Roseomonas sp. NAR14]|uniref:DUF983 domain-containing protein n=1 Tax=Roseomonas acroporae TaxID=2937791 RepID=A0A9X1YB19_9PROT|nr:DUF983 domain-containing protein [Roseomonas acroporae]MCK8783241.1 DUF983 domain-containing protein [Roseomonas acroporae]
MRWEPARATAATPYEQLPLLTALGRGATNHCPACGVGRVFDGYLKVVPECAECGAPLGALRADDAPPYFTIFLVGHLLVPIVFWVETRWHPPMWLHMALWLPLFAIACTLILRPVKGAVVGWMLRLGFAGQEHHGGGLENVPPRPAQPPSGPAAPGPEGAARGPALAERDPAAPTW